MTHSMLTVMVYDVSADSRRTRLYALLQQYGVPVQKSAFEGYLTLREREQLIRQAERMLDATTDRFFMYTISRDQEAKIAVIGSPRPVHSTPTFYLI